MSQSRKKSRFWLGLFLTSFLFGLLGAAGFSQWLLRENYSGFSPCANFIAPFQLGNKKNCAGEMISPRGRISFYSNEDGLRDLARDDILKNSQKIMVLGDSLVEGGWLKSEETIPHQLQEKIPGKYFINAGLRERGPLWQVPFLKSILPIYQPQDILWFIDALSAESDQVACQVLGDPTKSKDLFERDMSRGAWLGERLATKLRAKSYEKSRKAMAYAEGESLSCHCAGIRQMKDFAHKNGLSVFPVAVVRDKDSYLKKIQLCLDDWGRGMRPFLILDLSNRPEFFYAGSDQLNPLGAQELAREIARRTEF